MNRIYKLVLVVEVSARNSSGLSMSVRINVITDINIFVRALRRPVGPHITQPEPAAIATVGIGTEMPRRVHLAAAAARGDDVGWWGTGGLRARRGGVLTRIARGLVGEARKGLRDTAGLAGW